MSALRLDPEDLAKCVGCGLCLPHCPTYRVTGDESRSPRGRIATMRLVEAGTPIDDEVAAALSTCVQCLACEPACPSGVPYGRMMERATSVLASSGRTAPWWQRIAYRALGHHRLVLAGSSALALAQRLHLVPRRLRLGRLPIRRPAALRPTGDEVWLFTGCVMDAWQRDVHHATAAVLGAIGVTFRLPGDQASCCGALHTHAGLSSGAKQLAARVVTAMPGDAPVLVNSAGCGAQLKHYGELLGTPEAHAFAARVRDIHEFVAERADRLPALGALGPVIVQDPCHLRHVQRVHLAVHALLARCATVVPIDDDGRCCGAGGAYFAVQSELAGQMRGAKLAAIDAAANRAGVDRATVVASANPGCATYLAAAGAPVRHPMQLLAEAVQRGGQP